MKNKVFLWTACGFFGLFLAVLLSVLLIDVRAVGPQGSEIGLAAVNVSVHAFFGVSEAWDKITDVLAALVIAVAAGLAGLGVYQLIKRKSLKKVDGDLLWLCVFSVIVILAYVIFEILAVNYRPILTEEGLEASFPSTHTTFAVFVMGGAAHQALKRLPSPWNKLGAALCALVAFVISFGRLLAGVHWLTDVLGGVFLGLAFVCLYIYFADQSAEAPSVTAEG